MNNVPNIGLPPAPYAERDAIHIAVIPVVADTSLEPGAPVVMSRGRAAAANFPDSAIGVVDPFRGCAVNAGERFWLFMKPSTVQSLRHEWEHPAFITPEPRNTFYDVSDEPGFCSC